MQLSFLNGIIVIQSNFFVIIPAFNQVLDDG